MLSGSIVPQSVQGVSHASPLRQAVSPFRDTPYVETLFDDESKWDNGEDIQVSTEKSRTVGKSLKIRSTNGNTKQVTVNFSKPVNLLSEFLRFHSLIENRDSLDLLRVFFFNAKGYGSNVFYSGDFKEGEWVNTFLGVSGRRENWSDSPNGIDDFKTVTSIRLDLRSKPDQECTLFIDNLFKFKNQLQKPLITISFDDGFLTDLTVAKPAMDKYGFRGATFIAHDRHAYSNSLKMAGMKELYEAGWDVSHHGWNHIEANAHPIETVEQDFKDCYDWLINNGFYRSAHFIAYPHGQANKAVKNVARKHCSLGRGGDRNGEPTALQTLPVVDNMSISSQDGDNMSVAAIKAQIDLCKKTNRWYNLFFHLLADQPGNMSPAGFREIIDYIYEQGLTVVTYSDMMIGVPENIYSKL